MSTDDTKLTVRIVSGQKTTLTSSKKNVADPTFTPIATRDTPPSSTTTTKENNTLSVVTTTDEVEKKDIRNESKRFPTSYLYVSFIFIAAIIILAGALGGTLGKTTASSDTTSVATVSIPSQGTTITIMVDLTICDNPPCPDFNLTSITFIRCLLINNTNTNNNGNVYLSSWMESNGTIVTISSSNPLNQGDCSTVSTFRRRQLQQTAVFGVEPVNAIAANFSVNVPPTTTNTVSLTTQACSTNVRLRVKGCTSGTTVVPATPSSSVTPSTSPSVSLTSTSTATYLPPGVSPSNSPSTTSTASSTATYLPPGVSPSNSPSTTSTSSLTSTATTIIGASVTSSSTSTGTSTSTSTSTATSTSTSTTTASASNTPSITPSNTPSSSPSPSNAPYNYWYTGNRGNYGFTNDVHTLAVYKSKLYIGGRFYYMSDSSTSANRIAAWDGSTWSTLPCGSVDNGVNDYVHALVVYNNQLYIGGEFSALKDGTSAKRIVAWNGTSFSTLPCGNSNGVNDYVRALSVYNNKLYIGGRFSSLGDGTSANYIVAWDDATSTWSTLGPSGSSNGLGDYVYAFGLYNNQLYIGGSFSSLADGTNANRVVAWNGASFSNLPVDATSNGLNYDIFAFAVYNDQLYIGGDFYQLGDGTTSAERIVAWNGTSFSTLPCGSDDGLDNTVHALAVYNDKLYIGGRFSYLGDDDTSSNYIVAWNGTSFSSLVSGSGNGVDYNVYALTIYNDKLYAGGAFSKLGDDITSVKSIVTWDNSSFSIPAQTEPAFRGLSDRVNAMVSYKNKIYIGGSFIATRDDSVSIKRIAAYDPVTMKISNLPQSSSKNGLGYDVNTLAVYDDQLYIGGAFSSLDDGTSANRIVAWNGSAFSTLPCGSSNGVDAQVFALAVYNNKLYIGGSFEALMDGTIAYNVITYDGIKLSTLANYGITGKASNVVNAFAVYKNRLYIGGKFAHVADYTMKAMNIVAYDENTYTSLSYGTSNGLTGGEVRILAVCNDELFIGGTFTSLGDGTYAKGLVRWDGTTFANVTTTTGGTITGNMYTFGVVQSTLYIGGDFTSLSDGTSVNRIIGYDGKSWSNVTIGNATGIAEWDVRSLYADGNVLYIGGKFQRLGDGKTVVNNLAWTAQSLTYPYPSGTPSNTPTPSYTPSASPTISSSPSILPSSSPSPNNMLSNYWYTGISGNYGVTDGYSYTSVRTMVTFNNKLYIGGSFEKLTDGSTSASYIAAWDGSTWSTLDISDSRNGVNNIVNALAVYNNQLYIGGRFVQLGDYSSANRIVAWNGTSFSTLPCGIDSNGVNDEVYALIVYNNKLYIGGSFDSLQDGTSANRIVAYDGSVWSTLPCTTSNGFNSNNVYSLGVYINKLYIGGEFNRLDDGTSANGIIAWDDSTSTWSSLNTSDSDNGVYGGSVRAMTVYNNKLYVGGNFYLLEGGTISANFIVAWDGSTRSWSTLPTTGGGNGLNRDVHTLVVYNNQLCIGGFFTEGDGFSGSYNYVALYDASTSSWSNLPVGISNGLDDQVDALAVYNNQLYIGGSISKLGDDSLSVKTIVVWNGTVFSRPVQSTPAFRGLSDRVNAMVSYKNKIYIGGSFTATRDDSVSIKRIAAYDPVTMKISNLPQSSSKNGLVNSVNALSVYNDQLYIGGSFTKLDDGTVANYIAAWDGSTWSTLPCGSGNNAVGLGYIVYGLAVYNNKLYIGGGFVRLGDGSTSARYIVAWNGTSFSNLPQGTTNGVGGYIYALGVYKNKLYIGGSFYYLADGITSANGIVAYDGSKSTWLTLGPSDGNGLSSTALTFAVYNDELYIGGGFSALGDMTYAKGLVRWDGNVFSFVRSTLDVRINSGFTVQSLTIGNGKLYIGGSDASLSDGTSVNRIIGYDGKSWSNVKIGNATGIADGSVYSLCADGNILYAGGQFQRLGDGKTVVNNLVWTGI